MATPEQKAASRKIMDAVTALNQALLDAGGERLHIELKDVRERGMIVPQYQVETIEARETVLP
jgi:hypothetical protein